MLTESPQDFQKWLIILWRELSNNKNYSETEIENIITNYSVKLYTLFNLNVNPKDAIESITK